jgi:hypothetical protein
MKDPFIGLLVWCTNPHTSVLYLMPVPSRGVAEDFHFSVTVDRVLGLSVDLSGDLVIEIVSAQSPQTSALARSRLRRLPRPLMMDLHELLFE